jgi:hypothetical protein
MKTWLDLTDACPFKFDVEKMRADVATLEKEGWLTHYDPTLSRKWRAILLVSKHGDTTGPESQRPSWDFTEFKRTPYVEKLPYFKYILDSFVCPQGRVRILKLAPGAGIDMHRDINAEVGCLAFNQVRLHVPIHTNDKVTFFVGGEKIKMQPGRFYYVNFSKKHYVRNDGDTDRLHLVMDLKVNDWLRKFFPKTTLWEKFEYLVARATWPTYWKILRVYHWCFDRLWSFYEYSVFQSFVHWLKGKPGIYKLND